MPRRRDRQDEPANLTISQELTGFHKERKRSKKKEITTTSFALGKREE
jgi:hypothetical protein